MAIGDKRQQLEASLKELALDGIGFLFRKSENLQDEHKSILVALGSEDDALDVVYIAPAHSRVDCMGVYTRSRGIANSSRLLATDHVEISIDPIKYRVFHTRFNIPLPDAREALVQGETFSYQELKAMSLVM